MIYELSSDGYRLGVFPSEAEAIHHAAYLPKGCYKIREWAIDGEFMIFDTAVNSEREINN